MFQKSGPRGGQFQTYANEKIKAPRIVVIGPDGEKLGEFSRDRALDMAQQKSLDLVQLAYNPKDKVCTAKLVDLGKYLYDKKKQDKEKKKVQKLQSRGMKQVKLGYSTGTNDVELKLNKAKEFLAEGYTVKVIIRLRGREKMYKDKVIERLKNMETEFATHGKFQYPHPKEEKNGYAITLVPVKVKEHGVQNKIKQLIKKESKED